MPLEAGRYHSNDTASSTPSRISAPATTKRRCRLLLERARGRLLLSSHLRVAESVVESTIQLLVLNSSHAAYSRPSTISHTRRGGTEASPEHTHLIVTTTNL